MRSIMTYCGLHHERDSNDAGYHTAAALDAMLARLPHDVGGCGDARLTAIARPSTGTSNATSDFLSHDTG